MTITVCVAFQAPLSISRTSILIRPDRCLESQGLAKDFEEVPPCFISVYSKVSSCLVCWGKIPKVLRAQTSPQRISPLEREAWEEAKYGGGLFLKVVHLPQIWVFVEEGEEGEWRSSAKMMQDWQPLLLCMRCFLLFWIWKKEKEKEKCQCCLSPPSPPSRSEEKKIRRLKKMGGVSIKHFDTIRHCLFVTRIILFIYEKPSVENLEHCLYFKSVIASK